MATIFKVSVLVVLAAVLAGCGSGETSVPQNNAPLSPQPAQVVPGGSKPVAPAAPAQ